MNKLKICIKCNKLLDVNNFHFNRNVCISCRNEYKRQYYKNNKLYFKKKAKEYAEKKGLVFIEGKEIVEAWRKWSR